MWKNKKLELTMYNRNYGGSLQTNNKQLTNSVLQKHR